jgi:general bacterial porin, GBP family
MNRQRKLRGHKLKNHLKAGFIPVARIKVVGSAAHAQSSVTLFGLIDTSLIYSSNGRFNASKPSAGGGTQWQEFAGSVYTPRWGLGGI